MIPRQLLRPTTEGLWCETGGFHVDPWRPVKTAVVTHAHADHATPGCGRYIASPNTLEIMRVRFDRDLEGDPLEWGESRDLEECRISLHPAGHVLGSSQVRIERNDEVWCVTGDYKREPDDSCEPFELVECDTLLTESTFGLPIYAWPDPREVLDSINSWWRSNVEAGRTTILLAYAFGKAQRLLAGLDPSIGPIGIHGALRGPTEVYREAGIQLPPTMPANRSTAPEIAGRGVVICPPSATGTPWIRRFDGSGGMRLASVSGWMQVRGRRRWRSVDRGFVLSDHADWPGLLRTIRECGARRIGVTHGFTRALARYLREEEGLDSFEVPTRYVGESPPEGSGTEPTTEEHPAGDVVAEDDRT